MRTIATITGPVPVLLQDSCLLDVFARWEDAVAQFQAFWTVMERIDSELWVLDPEEPARRDTRRRLVVSEWSATLLRGFHG